MLMTCLAEYGGDAAGCQELGDKVAYGVIGYHGFGFPQDCRGKLKQTLGRVNFGCC